ncbi:MAG: hypothetical protein ACJ8HI_23650 [Massilia sp.]
MKVLQKTMLASVAGGTAEYVINANGSANSWESSWDAADYGGGGDFGGSSLSVGQYGGVSGNFDSNGVGATSCAPSGAAGLYGMSLTETLAAGGAVGGLATAIGQGVGASFAIEAAGGLAGVGEMGAGAAGLMGSAVVGVSGALLAGGAIGTLAYQHSETVRDFAQSAVGGVFQIIEDVKQVGATALGIERVPQHVYHP